MYTGNIKSLVCAVGRGRGWWGRAREIFIKIEHRLLKSGLGLTLLSLPCCFSVVLGSVWPVPGRLVGRGNSYCHRAESLDICLNVHGEQKSLSDFRELFQFCVVWPLFLKFEVFWKRTRTVLYFGGHRGLSASDCTVHSPVCAHSWDHTQLARGLDW